MRKLFLSLLTLAFVALLFISGSPAASKATQSSDIFTMNFNNEAVNDDLLKDRSYDIMDMFIGIGFVSSFVLLVTFLVIIRVKYSKAR